MDKIRAFVAAKGETSSMKRFIEYNVKRAKRNGLMPPTLSKLKAEHPDIYALLPREIDQRYRPGGSGVRAVSNQVYNHSIRVVCWRVSGPPTRSAKANPGVGGEKNAKTRKRATGIRDIPQCAGRRDQRGHSRASSSRTYFCNLTCTWCDSKYTWLNQDESRAGIDYQSDDRRRRLREGHELTTASTLSSRAASRSCTRELLLPILSRLKKEGVYIEVETNGTLDAERRDARSRRLLQRLPEDLQQPRRREVEDPSSGRSRPSSPPRRPGSSSSIADSQDVER